MNFKAWHYYISLYKTAYSKFVRLFLLIILQSALLFPIPLLVRQVFDRIIPDGNFPFLVGIGLSISLLYLISSGIAFYTQAFVHNISKIAIQKIRDEILKKIYSLSRNYYSQTDIKKLHTIIVQDTNRLDMMSNAIGARFFPVLFTSIVLSIVLLSISWFLFLVVISIVPVFFLFNKYMSRILKKHIQAYHRAFEAFSKGVLSLLQIMDLTRVQSAEYLEVDRQKKKNKELRIKGETLVWHDTAYRTIQNILLTSAGVIIVVVGGNAVMKGQLTLGELLSFYSALALLRNHLNTTLIWIPQIISGNESLTTLFNFLSIEDARPYTGKEKIEFSGKIILESVSFQYKNIPTLLDINVNIHPNTTNAIIGPNGAGKSTIIKLILGFYRPQKGQLYADDDPYVDLDIFNLRQQIGIVMQNPVVFSGTIFENMIYGHPYAKKEDVIQAAGMATAHEFIQQLPEGYDTFIGENGILLSGGQLQRIALARAILGHPRLLILDEPTNHLDDEAVYQLMNNLKDMATIIMIGHSLETVGEADHIYVLKEGRVIKKQTETLQHALAKK